MDNSTVQPLAMPKDGEVIWIRRKNPSSSLSLCEFRADYVDPAYGQISGAVLKDTNGQKQIACRFEDVAIWGRWKGESLEAFEVRRREWQTNPEQFQQLEPIRGEWEEFEGPAFSNVFERPRDGERIKVFTGTWDGWETDLIYKDEKVGSSRGILFKTRVVEYGKSVRETISDQYCNFDDVWQWKSIDTPDDGTMSGLGRMDDSKLRLRPGLSDTQRSVSLIQDRFASPSENQHIYSRIAGIWMQGTFNYDMLYCDSGGSFPFFLVECWKTDKRFAGTAGPAQHLDGPQRWEDFPSDTEMKRLFRDALRHKSDEEEVAIAQENSDQLQRELKIVASELQTAHSEEHAILILERAKKKNIWTDPDTGEVVNFFRNRFPLYDDYIQTLDNWIEERQTVIAYRETLRSEAHKVLVSSGATTDNSSAQSAPLFLHIAFLHDGAETVVREQLIRDKFISPDIDRDPDSKLRFNAKQQDLAYLVQKLIDHQILADTVKDHDIAKEFVFRGKSPDQFCKINPKTFKTAREKAKNQGLHSRLIEKTVRNIISRLSR